MGESEPPITVCAQCGETISANWVVCPICARPANQSVNLGANDDSSLTGKSLLCIKCEKQIAPDAQICPHCHVPIIRRYCSGCQRLIPDHAGLCPYCQAPPTIKRRFRRIHAIVALFLIGSTVFIFALLNRKDSHPKISATVPVTRASSPPALEENKASSAAKMPALHSEAEERESEEDPKDTDQAFDLVARGARLMQGRKLTRVGSQLLKQGQYQKAVLVLADAVRSFPTETRDATYGEALYYLGFSLRMSGKPEEAIPVLKRAMNFPYYRSKAARELQTASLQVKTSPTVDR